MKGVYGPTRLSRHPWQCPCFSVVVLEATDEASQGPLKGALSAQKALQVSETEARELLGGMEEKSFTLRGIFHQLIFVQEILLLPESHMEHIFFVFCVQSVVSRLNLNLESEPVILILLQGDTIFNTSFQIHPFTIKTKLGI